MITFVTGGARSGKSRFALGIAESRKRPVVIVTAEPFDDEMRERIRKHREDRAGRFLTVEEPVDLAGALRRLPEGTEIAVIDCLTVWLGNLLHRQGGERLSEDLGCLDEVTAFLTALAGPPCPLVLVSNEVGLGIVPANALARLFTDLAGRLNQAVAARADRVVLMVSGIPLAIKGSPG